MNFNFLKDLATITFQYFLKNAESIYLFIYLFGFFQDRVSLCSPGCPGTHFLDQDDLELRNLPTSAS